MPCCVTRLLQMTQSRKLRKTQPDTDCVKSHHMEQQETAPTIPAFRMIGHHRMRQPAEPLLGVSIQW